MATYRDYRGVSPFTARDQEQARCPSGWRAFVHMRPGPIPEGAALVATAQARPGERVYEIYRREATAEGGPCTA